MIEQLFVLVLLDKDQRTENHVISVEAGNFLDACSSATIYVHETYTDFDKIVSLTPVKSVTKIKGE